ncbi:hypothetical protein QTO34_012960 [Cnephaeus nilssonii]|uniref:DUF4371 domain-containing protein n=1 Tax=Cnephaeus nilssonii TaxID=3371016 RepID=A0AA40HAI3_CNENI|nr:hypothetical protein QTO34_012960 [Eptesicus nilssonii]
MGDTPPAGNADGGGSGRRRPRTLMGAGLGQSGQLRGHPESHPPASRQPNCGRSGAKNIISSRSSAWTPDVESLVTSRVFQGSHSGPVSGEGRNQNEEKLEKNQFGSISRYANKDAIIKRISELPLSRNIIKDRIMRLNTNVQHQLKRDIRKCKYFSISLDETTDVTSHAQLAIIGRYSDGLTMREELIKLVSVSTSKSGSEICKVVIQTFRDLSIDISKVVSVTTDGASNMVGGKVGFVKLFTKAIGHQIVPFHCIIHQEALCAKAGFTDFNDLMSVVTKIVNSCLPPSQARIFSTFTGG